MKKEMQPVHQHTPKKHQDNLQHWLLLACQQILLAQNLSDRQKWKFWSWGFNQVISWFELFELTIWLLVCEKTSAWILQCCF